MEVDHVVRRFGLLRAVDDVSLVVEEGERHALVGPNGAGKSTLFNMIAGGLAVSGGRIHFAGVEITKLKEHVRARLGIGKTSQQSLLFDRLPVVDNVVLALQRRAGLASRPFPSRRSMRAVTERAEDVLGQVGLAGAGSRLAAELSHGERRQLEVGVALAGQPRLLLLDEPTAGMSGGESSDFVTLVEGLSGGLTVLIIEHDLDVVFALATKVTVLQSGQLLASGTPGEIRASAQVQEAYLGVGHGESIFSEPG